MGASGRAEPRRRRAGHDDGLLDQPRVPGSVAVPDPPAVHPQRRPGDERLGEHHQLGAQVDGLGDQLLHAGHRGVAVEQHVRRLHGRHGEPAGHRVPDSTCSSQGPTNPSPVSYSRRASSMSAQTCARSSSGTPDSIWWRAPNDSRSNRTQSAAEGSRKGALRVRTSTSRKPAATRASRAAAGSPRLKGRAGRAAARRGRRACGSSRPAPRRTRCGRPSSRRWPRTGLPHGGWSGCRAGLAPGRGSR